MSGHSKWASIKHKKAATDAKKGKVFTRIIRELTMAAKAGGGDPAGNASLRKAVDDAKSANMPQDNIKKAIQRGTGELPGVIYEECTYEGYGPGGVAIIVEVTTENKNRTSNEIRKVFSKHGGNMGESGCVGWMFKKKGLIEVLKKDYKEEELMDIALEAGASDIASDDEEIYEITTDTVTFAEVKKKLDDRKVGYTFAEVTLIPQTYIKLTGREAEQMMALVDEMEEHDDVKNLHSNVDISKKEMERISNL
ncbi:MAG: YebC/PmpR family DNA-binding transcriptional regulator [Elusimicrobia bacterium]|nr:YebC/PmpR family DNA-binding transcriptional regulator [Elusimicrobiota bacterium]